MTSSHNDKVLYATQDGVYFIKLVGSIKYNSIAGFDAFVDKITHGVIVKDLLIDLDDADYLDSTNLGLLAVLASYMKKQFGVTPKMISSNPDITGLIENIGLDRVYLLIDREGVVSTPGMREIPRDTANDEVLARRILTAHKAIMDLSDKNRAVFHNVVELLEQDVEAKSVQSPDVQEKLL